MKKKYLSILCVVFFFFTFCSTERDSFLEKPIETNNPAAPNYPGEDFTLLPKDHVSDSDLYVEGEILQNQDDNPKFMLSKRKFQGMPSIGKDRLGNLYVTWIASTDCVRECNENYITVSLSKNNGRSWSHDKLILSVNPQDSTRMKDPNFFNDKFGNLYLYWGKHVQKKRIAEKEWAITWYSKIKLSDDGRTINYTQPRRIAEGIMLNKLFYSNISDQVVFPIARWYNGKPFIYKATYGTTSLVNFTKVGAIPIPAAVSQIHEHMVVQLKDSTYLGMVRTLNGIYYSKSKDGNTWENANKFTALGATTASRFYLGKLNSGRLILIFNNDTTRSNLTVCLSEDDGFTWPYKRIIAVCDNDPFGASYPDMIETDPGVLNIVYDYRRSPEGTINFMTIKEEDIISNNQIEVFRTKISTVK